MLEQDDDRDPHDAPSIADASRPAKRQRNFIARQACEACRIKKTRCDEDFPCSLCRSLGIECTYAERKPTKNEASIGSLFNILKRIESKIDHFTTSSAQNIAPESNRVESNYALAESPNQGDTLVSPQASFHSPHAHQTIHWPGMHDLIPSSPAFTVSGMERSFPTQLESTRPPIGHAIQAQIGAATDDWLASLSLSCVKELSNAYFDTFNRIYPFIDRDCYFRETLAEAVHGGFGYDVESCLVLNVMALGCMGLKSCEEGGFNTSQHTQTFLPIRQALDEEICGLSFFNEARKRCGFSLTERDAQSCQYYLTSALFYAQTMRPVDEWMMTNRAAAICAAFWKCPPDSVNDWEADMQSRLFWSAILLETVIVQELELPSSGLQEWEDTVPLPKFMASPYVKNSRSQNPDDSYYHYHFLAQIAQRIILSRVHDELFNANPLPTLAGELRHQLEQWRANLPEKIALADKILGPRFDCPADAVAAALLQTRYRATIYHLGRPFLYKAIQSPSSLTIKDLEICAEALQHGMDWGLTWSVCANMHNFMPLRFFTCGQMFGQLFIFHSIRHAKDDRVRNLLPVGFEAWCTRMLEFIAQASSSNPTIAKDFEFLSALYHVSDYT
ncbi:hypothetical protein B0J13DRAFT_598946 [Dactylonectria estremocensis]|uniref:Zn(2)-C6 fungal-type domain-containing protein n=1 Tax=Dactylonectria estremocensis TaxID=1079267 RepID=A0A9P9DTS9_9HYPO|nr:hypothetical protein B0J13DRAFT_598946 [Dactylonectria estremocensis]